MRKHGGKASEFINYLLSYLGLALFSCSLIGLVLFFQFVSELKTRYYQTTREKTAIIAADLQTQFESLQHISFEVASELIYQPYFLAQGSYYEMEMLKDFEQYVSNSSLAANYFLIYQSNGNIFGASRHGSAKYRNEVFFTNVLGLADGEALSRQLLSMKVTQVIRLEDPATILLCFPVKFVNSFASNAVLCFVVGQQDFAARVRITVGELDDFYEIYYDQQLIATDMSAAGRIPAKYKLIESAAADSLFTFRLYYQEQNILRNLSVYQDVRVLIVILTVLAGIIMFALYLAWMRFQPIARLNAKLQKQCGVHGTARNELRNLEDMLDAVIDQNKASSLRITEQMLVLKRQLIKLLLKGDYDETMQERLEFLQIRLTDRSLSVAVLKFEDAARSLNASERGLDELVRQIEDLGNNDIQFLGCSDKSKHEISVIIVMSDNSLLQDAEELIHSFAAAADLPVTIGLGGSYLAVGKLPASYLEATLSVYFQNPQLKVQHPAFELPAESDRKSIGRMVWAIRHGDHDSAIKVLAAYIDQDRSEYNTEMIQRIMYSNVLSILVNTAHELDIAIAPQQISAIMTAPNPPQLFECALEWVRYLCSHPNPDQASDEHTITLKVVDYVRSHYLENDLSLEKVADQFDVSVGYLSRLFKEKTGENYKNYVIKLRIDHAKRCLADGLSVSSTSEIVGYVNISHFIKVFKQLVGVTPLVYQKNARETAR